MRRFPRAQVSLEISLCFVAILLFLIYMLRIWFWANRELFTRQGDYINSRSATSGSWPIHSSAELSDGLVFRGEF